MVEDAEKEAWNLYKSYIAQTGFTSPETYAELLLFVELSGGVVACYGQAPDDFGLQFADWIIVTGSERISDRTRMLILAHEWCHWLRRNIAAEDLIRFYDVADEAEERDWEERIACAFARLF